MTLKNLLIFGFFIIALVIAQFAQAQSVDEVIDKYIAARGGKDKLNGIKSIYMEGSRQMMGGEVAVRITKVQGKLSRTEFDMGGSSGFFIITDKEGWNYIPMRMQKAEPMPADRVKTLETEMDIAGPLVDYAAKGHKAELIGKEDVEGTECYKIKLTLSSGKDVTYFIDTKAYTLLRSSQKGGMFSRGGTGDSEMLTDYSDWKAVDGIMIAHTVTLKPGAGAPAGQGGGMSGGTTFDKVELNKNVDAKLYKPE